MSHSMVETTMPFVGIGIPHIIVNPGEIALGGDDGREVVLGKRSAETRKVVARVTGRAKAFLGFRS